jgi:hypothetical protein
MKKYNILLSRFSISLNTWNTMTQRYSDCKIVRKGSCISFEGSDEDFDKLHDRLTKDESNMKIIGIYPA